MARNRTRNTREDTTDSVIPPVEDTTSDAVPDTENPEQAEVPLSQGKGGRYTMQNGRRVLRTD